MLRNIRGPRVPLGLVGLMDQPALEEWLVQQDRMGKAKRVTQAQLAQPDCTGVPPSRGQTPPVTQTGGLGDLLSQAPPS
jgi:hypothetical protein